MLAIMLVELAIHRLAVPALLPLRSEPPGWHALLARVGAFFFYLAVAFAFAALGRVVVRAARGASPHRRAFATLQVLGGLGVLAVCAAVLFAPGRQSLTFALDAVFTVAILTVVVAQLPSGGDLGARIGTILLALPLILHFYAPFALRFISGDDLGLPDRMQIFGQWSVVFAALATPYCFAPRPFTASAARLPPLVVALVVTVLSAIVVRRAAEVGMDLARDGLGVVLDPLAPVSMLALYIMALAAVTWTLVACLAAPSFSRRLIGVGIGLILLGGYAFEWPLQYLASFLGLLLISAAARRVAREEAVSAPLRAPRGLSDEVWADFHTRLVERVALERAEGEPPSILTVKAEDGSARTHLVWSETDVRVRVSLTRAQGRLVSIDYLAGREPELSRAPSWTLWARPADGRSTGHPQPPTSPGAATRVGDESFDGRFQLRDAGHHTRTLLADQEMRQRAGELLAGWTAFWPGAALRYRLVIGAPTTPTTPTAPTAPASPRAPTAPKATAGWVPDLASVKDNPDAIIGSLLEVLELLGAMGERAALPSAEAARESASESASEKASEKEDDSLPL